MVQQWTGKEAAPSRGLPHSVIGVTALPDGWKTAIDSSTGNAYHRQRKKDAPVRVCRLWRRLLRFSKPLGVGRQWGRRIVVSPKRSCPWPKQTILAIRATENIVKKIVAVAASHSMCMDARKCLKMWVLNRQRFCRENQQWRCFDGRHTCVSERTSLGVHRLFGAIYLQFACSAQAACRECYVLC